MKSLCIGLAASLSLPTPSHAYFDSPAEIIIGGVAGAAAIGAAAHLIKNYYFPSTKVATFVFSGPVHQTRKAMDILLHIKDNDAIDGFLFIVQCPGGAPGQSELLYHLIDGIAAKKPVVVQVIDCACSGGYLMIAPATAIVAPSLAAVGCIGVLSSVVKTLPEKFDDNGTSGSVEVYPFASGKYKGIHNSHAPFTDEHKERYQQEMDALYENFMHLVAHARGLDMATKDMWAEGKQFGGREALELKLIDYIGGFETALNVLKKELNKRGKRADNLEFIRFSCEL